VTFSVNGTPVGGAQPVTGIDPVINPLTDQVTTGAQATASYSDTQIVSGQTYNVTASYSGDTNYKASNSPVTKVSVQPDFVFSEAQNYITISAPGGNGNLALTITANDGYNGTVDFSSSSCSGLPAGAGCSFSPGSIAGSGSTTLTVTTTASTTGALRHDIRRGEPVWAMSTGGLITVGIVLLSTPRKRRCLSMLLPLLLCAFLIAALNCGGGGSSQSTSTQPPPPPSTPAGSYTVTITATSGNLSHKVTFTLNVQ